MQQRQKAKVKLCQKKKDDEIERKGAKREGAILLINSI